MKDAERKLRRMQTQCEIARLFAIAESIDLKIVRDLNASNPGPAFYVEVERAVIDFCERVRDIQTRLGHQREDLKADANAITLRGLIDAVKKGELTQ